MFNTVKRAFPRNVSTRSMSWGVKKMNYSVEMLNKDIPREITGNKYGIPYRVVNERAVFSTSSNSAVPKKDTKKELFYESARVRTPSNLSPSPQTPLTSKEGLRLTNATPSATRTSSKRFPSSATLSTQPLADARIAAEATGS